MDDQNNRAPPTGNNINRRIGAPSKPAPTAVADGRSAPYGSHHATSSYAEYLARELPQEAPPLTGLSLCSLFCGCGGFDLGFRSAGYKLAYANDLFAAAAATFEANLGHAVDLRDIREVTSDRVPTGIDVLTGGFPCVTFSMAGKRAGVEDTVNGMLYLELCRLIKLVKPKYFIAENVKGMITSNGGRDIRLVHAAFLRLGYFVEWKLINMADYGVPQTRERVIFVGIRRDQMRGSFGWPKPSRRRHDDKTAPKWLPIARSLQDAIGDGCAALAARNDDFVNKFISATSPAPTVVATEPPQLAQSNSEFRRMTVRETARIQSFPDWYALAGSMSDGYRQIGNAVPPLYAKQLATALLHYNERKVR